MFLWKVSKSILILCLIVFVSELIVMLIMSGLNIESKALEALVDSTILMGLMFPVTYFFVFRNWIKIYRELEKSVSTIKESEERYRSLTESSQDAIITADSQGLIIAWNRGAEKIFGYSTEEALKMELIKIIPEKYRGKHIEKMHSSLRNANYQIQSGIMEVSGLRRNGSEFPLEITLAVWNTSEGRFCSGIIRDITTRKETEAKITEERARSVTAARLASLGELSGSIAHEINNPLSIIQATIGSIDRKIGSSRGSGEKISADEVSSKLEVLNRMTERITKIMKGMLSYSRDGQNDSFRLEKVGDIFENISSLSGEKVKIRGGALKFDLSGLKSGACIYCKLTQIEQVLVNLLNNAFDVLENSPAVSSDLAAQSKKWIRVEAREKNRQIEISVSDSGPGVPPEIRDKIFQSFFTTKEVGKGTGLGLSISQKIMREHGGDLYADFTYNHGRFVLLCPSEPPLRKGSL